MLQNNHISIPIIETERLVLNSLSSEDKELYCHLYTDDFLTQHLGGRLQQEYVEKAFRLSVIYNRKNNFQRFTWVITEKQNNSKIGIGALVSAKNRKYTADIGTILVARSHGKGIAKETLESLMSFGFEKLALNKISGYSLLNNVVSYKLMNSLGFNYELNTENDMSGYSWNITKKQWLN